MKKKVSFERGNFGEPVFGASIEVYIGNIDRIMSWYQQEYGTEFEFAAEAGQETPEALAFKDEKRGVHGMVFRKDASSSVIAHECGHVSRMVLAEVGIPHTSDTDKCYSYYLGFLVEGVGAVKKMLRQKKKKKS